MDEQSLRALKDAGTVWAATGHGQPLVDAAVDALVAGMDSPSLRVLAGAPSRFADEEANELAADTFQELGLDLPTKFSEEAHVALARLKSQHFLNGAMTPRQLANELWSIYAACDYSQVLGAVSGLADWYSLIDDGVIPVDETVADAQVGACARELVDGGTPKNRHYFNRSP